MTAKPIDSTRASNPTNGISVYSTELTPCSVAEGISFIVPRSIQAPLLPSALVDFHSTAWVHEAGATLLDQTAPDSCLLLNISFHDANRIRRVSSEQGEASLAPLMISNLGTRVYLSRLLPFGGRSFLTFHPVERTNIAACSKRQGIRPASHLLNQFCKSTHF
jgi:hypothetical protein